MSTAPNLSILLHTRASGGGGAERVFATLAEGLARRGHRVTLAVDTDEDRVRPPGVEVAVLGAPHLRGVAGLARLLRERRYDVAAAAVSVSCVKLAAARLVDRRRTPMVVSFHGFEEWRTGRLSALAYRGLPVLSRMSERVVAVSDGLRGALVSTWGAEPSRTVRIYNPVVLDPGPSPDAATLAARPPLVAALGRLSPEKGMADLVEAVALMRRTDARVVIGGEGPERPALERRIADLGLGGRVRLLGQVGSPADVFGEARVAVAPSRTEAFGVALVEALGHGLPVVATDCDGPREILDGGRHGRLVPTGDPQALAQAVDAALDEPGDPAPRRARAEAFSVERGVDAWEAVLSSAAARDRGRTG